MLEAVRRRMVLNTMMNYGDELQNDCKIKKDIPAGISFLYRRMWILKTIQENWIFKIFL
jgi:hypothetical protein